MVISSLKLRHEQCCSPQVELLIQSLGRYKQKTFEGTIISEADFCCLLSVMLSGLDNKESHLQTWNMPSYLQILFSEFFFLVSHLFT